MRLTKINLSEQGYLVKGKKRLVFRHPTEPGLVIKVFKKKSSKRRKLGIFNPLYKRFAYLSSLTREIREFLYSRYEKCDPLVGYFADIVGFADTNLGLGIVMRAAVDIDGNLAPTLSNLIKQKKLTPQRIALLQNLFDRIIASKLVVGDLTARNIVLAHISEVGERFLLVDGLGDKTLIPLQRWLGFINRSNKIKRINKLRKRVEKAVKN